MTRTNFRGLAAIAAILTLTAANAPASTVIDLTKPGSSNFDANNIASVGGSFIVQQTDGQSTGGGVVDTFLRIQHDGSEQGYNTDGTQELDAKGAPTFTHSLLLSDVPTVTLTVNGVTELYRQFVLDIQDSGKLSLNQVQIFLRDVNNGNQLAFLATATNTTPPVIAFVAPNVQEVFALNVPPSPNFLEIQLKDSSKSDSSPGDMFLYVRDAAFQTPPGSPALPFVYLYAQFGKPPGQFKSDDGPEDWGVIQPPTVPVPEPSTVALALTGLGTLGFAGLRRRSRALQASD